MTSVFIVKCDEAGSYYGPEYSNVVAFSTRPLAEEFARKAQALNKKNVEILENYRKMVSGGMNRKEAAKILSEEKLTWQEIEKFSFSKGKAWEVEELTFVA